MSPSTETTERRRVEAGFTWSEFALVATLVAILVFAASWGISGVQPDKK